MQKETITILGSYGGKGNNMQLTSIQVTKDIVIDAGNIINGLRNGAENINHIFISHSHLDHINDIPYLIDNYFEQRKTSLKIYARKDVIKHLKEHIFNWDIWPDFSQINLINSDIKALEFIEIELNQTIKFDDCSIKAIENNHTPSSCGFVITKNQKAILFTSDTYCCDAIWEEVNINKQIHSVIVDVSFPSRLNQLAFDSKHLTPSLLEDELKKLTRKDIDIYVNHLKPNYKNELVKELIRTKDLLVNGKILETYDTIKF